MNSAIMNEQWESTVHVTLELIRIIHGYLFFYSKWWVFIVLKIKPEITSSCITRSVDSVEVPSKDSRSCVLETGQPWMSLIFWKNAKTKKIIIRRTAIMESIQTHRLSLFICHLRISSLSYIFLVLGFPSWDKVVRTIFS